MNKQNEKMTNYAIAEMIWNLMYPERRRFAEIGKDAQKEWEELARIARIVIATDELND